MRAQHVEAEEAEPISSSPPVRVEDALMNTAIYAPCSQCGQIIASTDVRQHICPCKGHRLVDKKPMVSCLYRHKMSYHA